MNYITILNEETELNKEKEKIQKKYEEDISNIDKRLEKLNDYKNDYLNNKSEFALAKEYVSVYCPEMILKFFCLYMKSLKKHLKENYKEFLTSDLQLLDNSYGGDYTKYTKFCEKGLVFNYHPDLGSIRFDKDTPIEYFNELIIELEKFSIKPLEKYKLDEYSYRYNEYNPFYHYKYLNYIYSFKIKTDKYDYTRLLELINFPKEIYCYDNYGHKHAKYKFNGISYDFYTRSEDEWVNEYEALMNKKI